MKMLSVEDLVEKSVSNCYLPVGHEKYFEYFLVLLLNEAGVQHGVEVTRLKKLDKLDKELAAVLLELRPLNHEVGLLSGNLLLIKTEVAFV